MTIDQAYKQNNREVKVDSGAISIMDNESALLEWALPGPYVAKMVCASTNAYPSNHYEDRKSFEKGFCFTGIKSIEAFKHFENPFSDSPGELMNVISKELMSSKSSS